MTKESQEVVTLRGKILSMEMDINLLSKDIEKLETEFFYTKKKINLFLENINFLKNSEVVVSLSEYKKIKTEYLHNFGYLYNVEKKINFLKTDLLKKEKNYEQEMLRFQHLYRLQFRSNILEFPSERRQKRKNT